MSGTRERISIAQAFGGMWEAYHRMVIKTVSYTHEQTGRTSFVPRPSLAPVFDRLQHGPFWHTCK